MPATTMLPPGPRDPRPVQIARFMRDEAGYLATLQARYGDAFKLQLERRAWYLLSHPDAIRETFQSPPGALHAGEANVILQTALGRHSVLLLDGEEHLRQRKLLLPAFHGDRLRAQRDRLRAVAEQQVERLPPRRPFALRPHTQAIAHEVILQIVLGVRPDDPWHARLGPPLVDVLDWYGNTRNLIPSTIFGASHPIAVRPQRRVVAPVDQRLYDLIRERRAEPRLEERDDVLSMLLLAHDEDGVPLRDEEVRDEVVTLLVAGHETTATALAWAYERLTRHPAALARLEAEARTDETAYAEAVAKETLRLRPVIMNVLRVAKRPIEIAGWSFPKGAVIAPSIHLVQRRTDVWGPDAADFRPDRFLEADVPSYAWIPFGGGVRRCIGASFALMEMEVVLRAIAGSVHLEPVGEPERRVSRFITSSPARGGEVRVGGEPGGVGEPVRVRVAA